MRFNAGGLPRRRLLALGGGVAAVLGGARVEAKQTERVPAPKQTDAIGSWVAHARLDDGGDDFHMMSFLPNGVLLLSGEASLIPSPFPGMDECSFNAGHGTWVELADGAIQGHCVMIVQDRNQEAAFLAHLRATLRLAGSDQLAGRCTFEFVRVGMSDPAATSSGTVLATRVDV
jgi:hypothetical protein